MKAATLAHDYHCTIMTTASAAEAFKNICNISAWWATDFEGRAEKPGDLFTVYFDSGETFMTLKIRDAIPGKKISWLAIDCNLHWVEDKKEWKDTEIIWEIFSRDNATQIAMTHIGLVPGKECYDDCEMGWNRFIKKSLFRLLTEQKGMPEGGRR